MFNFAVYFVVYLHQDQTVRDITSGLIAAGVGCGVATLFLLSVSTAALSYARRRERAKHKQMQSLARREAQRSPNAEADETSPRGEWGMGSPKRGGVPSPPAAEPGRTSQLFPKHIPKKKRNDDERSQSDDGFPPIFDGVRALSHVPDRDAEGEGHVEMRHWSQNFSGGGYPRGVGSPRRGGGGYPTKSGGGHPRGVGSPSRGGGGAPTKSGRGATKGVGSLGSGGGRSPTKGVGGSPTKCVGSPSSGGGGSPTKGGEGVTPPRLSRETSSEASFEMQTPRSPLASVPTPGSAAALTRDYLEQLTLFTRGQMQTGKI